MDLILGLIEECFPFWDLVCNQMSVRLKFIFIMEKWVGPLSDSRWETRLGNTHQNTQKMDTCLSWMCLGTNTVGWGVAQFCKGTLLCPSECSFYQSLFSQETKHKLVPFTKTTKYKEWLITYWRCRGTQIRHQGVTSWSGASGSRDNAIGTKGTWKRGWNDRNTDA